MDSLVKTKSKTRRLIILYLLCSYGGFMLVISAFAFETSRDGWMTILPAWIISALLSLTTIVLSERYKGQTPVQYLPKILGKIPGKIAAIIIVFCIMFIPLFPLKYYLEIISLILPETPSWAILALYLIVSIYTITKGFENYMRAVSILLPLSLIIIWSTTFLILPECDFSNLKPFLEDGTAPLGETFVIMLTHSILVVPLSAMWLPSVEVPVTKKNSNSHKKWAIVTIVISGTLLSLGTIIQLAFSGFKITSYLTFPIMYMIRYITIGDFITGFEALLIFYWITIVFFHSLIFIFSANKGLEGLLGRNIKPIPIAALIIGSLISLSIHDIDALNTLNMKILMPVSLSIGFFFPIVMIIDTIKNRVGNQKNKKQ